MMFTRLNALIVPPPWDLMEIPSFVPIITINYQMGGPCLRNHTMNPRQKTGCLDSVSFCAGPSYERRVVKQINNNLQVELENRMQPNRAWRMGRLRQWLILIELI